MKHAIALLTLAGARVVADRTSELSARSHDDGYMTQVGEAQGRKARSLEQRVEKLER
jgi:hypothetical protein